MTREELRGHCERQIQQFERVKKIMPVTPNDWKRYEEHKLLLELLEQTRWIPVSEKLPENKTYVLTTIKVPNRIAHTRSGWYEGGFFHNDNGDVWRATDMEVIAWMPLPDPYKAESEG